MVVAVTEVEVAVAVVLALAVFSLQYWHIYCMTAHLVTCTVLHPRLVKSIAWSHLSLANKAAPKPSKLSAQ